MNGNSRASSLLGAALCGASLLMVACSSTSKRGMEARKAAHERVGRVNTGIAMEQGERALRAGDFPDAIKVANGVLKVFPDDPDALMLRGRTLQEMYRAEEAAADFRAVLTVDPSRADASYYLGVIHERFGRLEEASEAYEAACCTEPRNLQYAMASVEVLVAQGELDQALSLLDEVTTRFEFSHQLMHLHSEILELQGKGDEAYRWLLRAETIAPPGTYDRELALTAFGSRHYGSCLGHIDHLVESGANEDSELLRMRARCLMMTGRQMEARDLMAGLVEAGTLSSGADWVVLGEAAWLAGDWRRVGEAGSRLESAREYPTEAALFQGAAAVARGDRAVAERKLREALDSDGSCLPAQLMLAQIAE